MFDFLDNFEKRMEWIGIANSIINRKGRNTEIEGLFDEHELTNIIISVLLFIMEKTLEENNECEMHHIETFLDQLTRNYHRKSFSRNQIREIAGYIIKDILQNNGVRHAYPLINYSNKLRENITIRLIADKIADEGNERKIVYMLTNQGYEFLFRTREVDEEIQLTIEQLKLKEYIKRKKFSSAVRQSVELISFVRQKKKDIEHFILSIRQNIHNVEVEKYETLIKSTYAMLTEEYETMADIQKLIRLAEERLKEDTPAGENFEQRLTQAKHDIMDIHHNIGLVITEQRDLIINRHSLTELYMDTIKKSFEFSFEKRYDFEEAVLANLERYVNVLDNCLGLLKPLLMPARRKILNAGSIYSPQTLYKEMESQDAHMLSVDAYDDSLENERIKKISERNVAIMSLIMSEAMKAGTVHLSAILKSLRDRDFTLYSSMAEDRRIFLTALRLYDVGSIAVKSFYGSPGRVLLQPSEELNIEYCLIKMRDEIQGIGDIREFITEKAESDIQVTIEIKEANIKATQTIEMTDLIFRAVI